MFVFTLKDNQVIQETKLNNGWTVSNKTTLVDGLYAQLVKDKILESLNQKIESIRREAYEQGYKDKAAKRARKKHFNGNINSDTVGWE